MLKERQTEIYRMIDEVESELLCQQNEATGNFSCNENSKGECVWCGQTLFESPTDRFWTKGIEVRQGLCHRCVVNSMRGVVCGLRDK
jgi:hypothetical protein